MLPTNISARVYYCLARASEAPASNFVPDLLAPSSFQTGIRHNPTVTRASGPPVPRGFSTPSFLSCTDSSRDSAQRPDKPSHGRSPLPPLRFLAQYPTVFSRRRCLQHNRSASKAYAPAVRLKYLPGTTWKRHLGLHKTRLFCRSTGPPFASAREGILTLSLSVCYFWPHTRKRRNKQTVTRASVPGQRGMEEARRGYKNHKQEEPLVELRLTSTQRKRSQAKTQMQGASKRGAGTNTTEEMQRPSNIKPCCELNQHGYSTKRYRMNTLRSGKVRKRK